jgi:hypothetical protein
MEMKTQYWWDAMVTVFRRQFTALNTNVGKRRMVSINDFSFYLEKLEKKRRGIRGWGYSSVVEHLPSMGETPALRQIDR